jgi:hypothetical protein
MALAGAPWGLDAWDWSGAYSALASEKQRSAALDGFADQLHHAYQAKRAIGADLAAGRLTLPEAVKRFQLLVVHPALFWKALRNNEVGASDEERLCRHVIAWAAIALEEDPGTCEAVIARLEKELRRHLAGNAERAHPNV